MSKKLENKIAVVTGATSGIGIGIVNSLARAGAKVVFCGRREDKGRSVESDFKNQGFDVTYMQADVSQEDEVITLVKRVVDLSGTIDILVNNAGVISNFSIMNMNTESDLNRLLNTNVKAQFITVREVVQVMKEKGGNIVNIASIAGLNAQPYLSAYGASKAASISFTKSMAKELAPMGIRVNGVLPGPIYSEMVIKGTESEKMSIAAVPMGRCGEPDEIGSVVAFLVSDDASFITGATIPVDGGASL